MHSHLAVSGAEVVEDFLEGAARSATLGCLLAALALNGLNLRSSSILRKMKKQGEEICQRSSVCANVI